MASGVAWNVFTSKHVLRFAPFYFVANLLKGRSLTSSVIHGIKGGGIGWVWDIPKFHYDVAKGLYRFGKKPIVTLRELSNRRITIGKLEELLAKGSLKEAERKALEKLLNNKGLEETLLKRITGKEFLTFTEKDILKKLISKELGEEFLEKAGKEFLEEILKKGLKRSMLEKGTALITEKVLLKAIAKRAGLKLLSAPVKMITGVGLVWTAYDLYDMAKTFKETAEKGSLIQRRGESGSILFEKIKDLKKWGQHIGALGLYGIGDSLDYEGSMRKTGTLRQAMENANKEITKINQENPMDIPLPIFEIPSDLETHENDDENYEAPDEEDEDNILDGTDL